MPPYIWMPHMCGCTMYGWIPLICLDAPLYVWMAPVCLNAPYVWTPLYSLMSPVCLDTLYVWMMFGCPPYIHNTKKECFVTLRGVLMPHTFGCPPYVWMAPCMFGCHYMFGWTTVCLNALICLDTPCMFGSPYMFGCPSCLDTLICLDASICLNTLLYAGVMFGCPLYIQNT